MRGILLAMPIATSVPSLAGCGEGSPSGASNPQATQQQCEILWGSYEMETQLNAKMANDGDVDRAIRIQLRTGERLNALMHRGCCRYPSTCLAA